MIGIKKNTEWSDAELKAVLDQVKSGEQSALAQLIAAFYPKIYRYVYYRLDNPEDAKDLTNDIFVKVTQAIKNQKGAFNAWIYRIAANALTDFYRHQSVRRIVTNEVRLPEYSADGDQMADNIFQGPELERAIKKLTDEQQQVIILRFVEGYPSQEIANIMEKSPEAVRAIQFRALNALRKILGEG